MLNECDHELERRRHRFVRYADDLMIFSKSRKAAQRTLKNIIPYIEGKLFLTVNREKTKVAEIRDVRFLGYGFYIYQGEGRLKVHPKSAKKLKDRLREVTGRSNGLSVENRRAKLNYIIRGWVNYFKLADMKKLMETLDQWLRRRLRMVTWKRWKKARTRYANLKKAGIPDWQAWQWAYTRLGYWRVAGSWILTRAMPNEVFKKAGYLSLKELYLAAHV